MSVSDIGGGSPDRHGGVTQDALTQLVGRLLAADQAEAGRPVQRTPAMPESSPTPAVVEAIVVDLGATARESVLLDGRWFTDGADLTLHRPAPAEPLPSAPAPAERPTRPVEPGQARREATLLAAALSPRTNPETAGVEVSLGELVVVLKKSGGDYRDAVGVLTQLYADRPLPPGRQLRALWDVADTGFWQDYAPPPRLGGELVGVMPSTGSSVGSSIASGRMLVLAAALVLLGLLVGLIVGLTL